ncbi:histone H3-lysine(4) N-trimethyltransferase ATX1-like isoform X9 [Magnolia sinica]|uniref:histone H3-lysine(4) N-trimethyltransferase ATX1-like isoform X9 n=1 Tax=Magnolia sinica TaxID=86752 RepID=UPI002658B2F4|nr:histone H3-lysine(4) N-trimethyltransferase ATX1-like isoform X9 [Magnolia sinica]
MEVKHLKNVGNHVGKDSEAATKGGDDKLRKEFTLGDIVWIKIYDSSWWPAQVVDENTIGGGEKIEKKMEGGVLTRLYGSYEYLYVDPMKYHSEFENVLKQNNCSVKEILNKALEQDLSQIKSGAKSKRKASTRKGKLQDGVKSNLLEAKARDESCKDKISVQDGVKKKKKADGQDSDGVQRSTTEAAVVDVLKTPKQGDRKDKKTISSPISATNSLKCSQDMSARRMRVMQSLGLIAPCGSPFQRVGLCKVALSP